MYMKLNREHAPGFVAFVMKKLRADLCQKRENVSTIVLSTVLWTVMNVCFTTGGTNRTFWVCQRAIAKRVGRSERWIYEIFQKLREEGYLEKVGQKKYGPKEFGPNIFRLGPKLKAFLWAFQRMNPLTYADYIKRKWDLSRSKKQTSDINLKKDTNPVLPSASNDRFSFIPPIREWLKTT